MISPNPFALFDLPISPSLDTGRLNERFNELTAQLHPDKFQSAPALEKAAIDKRFLDLNTAYQILADPKQRLLYLYETAAGSKPPDVQRIPPGTMDLFIEIGQLCRDMDTFLQKYETATGALARVGLANDALIWQEKLQEIKGKVQIWGEQLEVALQKLAATWSPENVTRTQLSEIEMIYRKFSYLARWKQQLEERELALFNVL